MEVSVVTKGSRHLLASLLVLCSVLIPLPAFAVSAACANFSPASFQGMGGASGAFINYAPGPFLPGARLRSEAGEYFLHIFQARIQTVGYVWVMLGGMSFRALNFVSLEHSASMLRA